MPTPATHRIWRAIRDDMMQDPLAATMWREDAQAGVTALAASVAGLIGMEDAPTPLAAEILTGYLRSVDMDWLRTAILSAPAPVSL